MIKRLVPHGNSAALIIDKPILQLLKVDENASFEVATDGKSLILSPVADTTKSKRFAAALKKVNTAHGKTLRKLAE